MQGKWHSQSCGVALDPSACPSPVLQKQGEVMDPIVIDDASRYLQQLGSSVTSKQAVAKTRPTGTHWKPCCCSSVKVDQQLVQCHLGFRDARLLGLQQLEQVDPLLLEAEELIHNEIDNLWLWVIKLTSTYISI